MKSKILIIDNYDSFTYNLRQIVDELHYEYSIIKNDEINIDEVDKFHKILITPGPGIPSKAGMIMDVIEKFYSVKSILGVCLGHQAIAQVFGAKLFNFKNVCHGLSAAIKILEPNDYLFKAIPQNFEAGLYHSWAVAEENFPETLKITSLSNENVIMSISHKVYDVKGVQFHPESIMTSYGRKIIENWLNN
jgi:anthranilate synthase component 2